MHMNRAFFSLAACGLIWAGCAAPSGPSGGSEADSTALAGSARHYYFSRVFSTAVWDTIHADTMALAFTVEPGGQVRCSFRWVLPGKDGKKGQVLGQQDGDTIAGRYRYQQEGGAYDDSIRVVLQPPGAVVTQFSADGYQLVDTLYLPQP